MTKSTDKAQANPDEQPSPSNTLSSAATAVKRDDRHFWRALKKDEEIQETKPASPSAKPIDLTADIDDLSDEDRESRRNALRTMLAASEARQQGAIRARRPTPEAGLRVGVRNGPFKGKEGIILDADYIQSRVLLEMDDKQEAQWVEFARLHSLVNE